jgi:hypothetical protein
MEQRTETRVRFSEPVLITALQKDEAICTGRFVDLSSNGIRIKSKSLLEVGSLLRLEVGEDLLMTEVRHCEPDEGEYNTGLLILTWLEKSELKRLLREAVVGPAPGPIPDDPALLVAA